MTSNAFDELRTAFEFRDDPITQAVYSVDASIYEIAPLGVVFPKTADEVVKILQITAKHQIPVIARGAATSTTGGCLGSGIILDFSRYMNRILEINFANETVVCEPGVVQEDLNAALFPHGYRLGPNTSTGNRATVGGMVGNNAAGSHSPLYGQTGDHVVGLDIVFAGGHHQNLIPLTIEAWKKSSSPFFQDLWKLREKYQSAIETTFPKIKRRSSGYNLDELIQPEIFNPCRLIAGSEGTLAIATKITFRICKIPEKKAAGVFHFMTMDGALHAVPSLLKINPHAIEMIDRDILTFGKKSPLMQSKLAWLQGDPEAVLVVEANDLNELLPFKDRLGSYAFTPLNSNSEMDIWAVRNAGLELLLSKRSYQRALAFAEDVAVPPEALSEFVQEFKKLLDRYGKRAGIYGHVSSGCIHIRPYFDLRSVEDRNHMHEIMESVSTLMNKYKGVMSSEHGDGLVRSWLNEKIFGPKIYQAFLELKQIFDPQNLLNPGKKVNAPPFLKDLREGPKIEMNTFQDFSAEGGFELAVDLCNGNGLCRKKETLMCPSFQATGDEKDSTRARAQALRTLLQGRLTSNDLGQDGIIDILDLCLECKGCKKECPSQVDMAKFKAEALYHHHKTHPPSLRSRLFGGIGTLQKWGSFSPTLTHFIGSLCKKFIGIAPERDLPRIAQNRFSSWFKNYSQGDFENEIVLFNDTFTEFNEPEIGRAAVRVLNAMGYKVIVPTWTCCGRPLISKGLLDKARQKAETLIERFLPYVENGKKIIGLEPSCILSIIDDIPSLTRRMKDDAQRIAKNCLTIDEFLADHMHELSLKKLDAPILLHGHCHQKALVGTGHTLKVLKALTTGPVAEIPSGCCGMAGSFGYEEEHYALSMKIGELKLFPAIRKASEETIVIADGFSCRCQVEHGTGKKAVHLVQLVANCI